MALWPAISLSMSGGIGRLDLTTRMPPRRCSHDGIRDGANGDRHIDRLRSGTQNEQIGIPGRLQNARGGIIRGHVLPSHVRQIPQDPIHALEGRLRAVCIGVPRKVQRRETGGRSATDSQAQPQSKLCIRTATQSE